MYYDNNYLMHHGVKGMKWGVRHDPQPGSRRYYKQQYKAEKKSALNRMKKTGQRLTLAGKQNDMRAVKKMTDQYDKDMRSAKQKYRNANNRAEQQVRQAKQEYKQAKKQYNKDFKKYYNKSISAWSPVDKHRRNNEKRFQKSLVSAGEMAIKKGNYLQAKGKLRDNQKAINKGKFIANRASLAKKYNSTVLSDLNKGYTLREAHGKNQKLWSNSVKKQSDMTAEYRRNR